MTATNLNNWDLVSDAEFPNDTLYETSFTIKKYQDLENKGLFETKTVVAQANINTGSTTFFELSNGSRNKIQARDKDGNQTVFDSALNTSYFSFSDLDTFTQYDNIITESRDKIISENYANGQFESLRIWNDFTSDLNSYDFTTDLDINLTNDSDPLPLDPTGENQEFAGREVPINAKTTLRYPKTTIPSELGYDYIRITAYEYTASGDQGLRIGGKTSAKERLIQEANKLETIILPMQPNFSESNAVSWGGDNLDPMKLAAANLASTVIEGIGNLGQEGNIEKIQSNLSGLTSDVVGALKDDFTGPALVAYFAGQAVGANILGRTAGVTLNPNLELLFKGPNLRTFNFNFRFTPRSSEESREIKEIIRCFKKNMAVQRSTSNLFLLTPNVFTVEYIYNEKNENSGQLHPYLNVFKPMAMTNFNVNYTPDGSYMTYHDGSLTQYDVQMSFGEIEPIYADEYDGTETGDSAIGNFNDHINMGY